MMMRFAFGRVKRDGMRFSRTITKIGFQHTNMNRENTEKPKFCIGDRVKLVHADFENPQTADDIEVGVVVWVWWDEIGFFDYYVAFFGSEFPDGKPEKPYILRYGEATLRKWSEDD